MNTFDCSLNFRYLPWFECCQNLTSWLDRTYGEVIGNGLYHPALLGFWAYKDELAAMVTGAMEGEL